MHIHVGNNIPGYLSESDAACFDDVTSALEAFRGDLQDQRDFYYEGCEAASEQKEKDSECCAWCAVASNVETALSAIADGSAARNVSNGHGRVHIFNPPAGSSVVHWLMFADISRDTCQTAREQGDV